MKRLLFYIMIVCSGFFSGVIHAEMTLPSIPSGMPNSSGVNSYNPQQVFSAGEYVDLSDGHLVLSPENLKMQLGSLKLSISPVYNPERNTIGKSQYTFSSFFSGDYRSIDDDVYVLDTFAPLGNMGNFIASHFGDVSSFRVAINPEQWKFAINGIVGVIGAEIELGSEDRKLTVFFLVKSDGNVVFLSTAEQGFKKAYKIIGDHHFGGYRYEKIAWDPTRRDYVKNTVNSDRLVIEDENGVQYTFNSEDGFGYQENIIDAFNYKKATTPEDTSLVDYSSISTIDADSRIETVTCWTSWFFFRHCDKHYNFPGWKTRLLFLTKIKDINGNEINISKPSHYLTKENHLIIADNRNIDPERIITVINTGKTRIGFVRKPQEILITTNFNELNPVAVDGSAIKWKYVLDDKKRITEIHDPEDNVTYYHYEVTPNLPQQKKLGPVFDRDPSQVVEISTPLGGFTRYEVFGNTPVNGVIVSEYPDLTKPENFFQKYIVAEPLRTLVYSEGGAITRYEYDNKDGLRMIKQKVLSYNNEEYVENYGWKKNEEIVDGMSTISNVIDGVTYTTSNKYDSLGRIIETTNPLGEKIFYSYHCDSNNVKSISMSKTSGAGTTDNLTLNFEPFMPTECEFSNIISVDISNATFDVFDAMDLIDTLSGDISDEDIDKIMANETVKGIIAQLEAQLITQDVKGLLTYALSELDKFIPDSSAELFKVLNVASVDEIDTFFKIIDTVKFLKNRVTDNTKVLIDNVLTQLESGNLQSLDQVYNFIHGAFAKVYSFLPVKPRIPYAVGKITLTLNGGAPVTVRQYLYEPRAEASLQNAVGYGNLIAEIDENNIPKYYLYHYCTILKELKFCDDLPDFQKDQLNKQLIFAEIYGGQPNEFVQTYNEVDALVKILPKDGKIEDYVATVSPLVNKIIKPLTLYYYDKGHQWNLKAKFDSNLMGYLNEFTDTGGVKKMTFVNGSSVKYDFSVQDKELLTTIKDSSREKQKLQLTTSQKYDGLGFVKEQIDAEGKITSFEYARNKKISKVTYPDGSFTSYYYDGLDRIIRIDSPGQEYFQFSYGRASVDDALGRSTPTEKITVLSQGIPYLIFYRNPKDKIVMIERLTEKDSIKYRYAYDEMGNLIKIKNPIGEDTSISFDGLSRVTKIVTPDNGLFLVNSYSGLNLPTNITIKEKDFNDIISNISYDNKGRINEVKYQGDQDPYVKYKYDEFFAAIPPSILSRLSINPNMAKLLPLLDKQMIKLGMNRITKLEDSLGSLDYFYEPNGDVLLYLRTLKNVPVLGDILLPSITFRDGFDNPISTIHVNLKTDSKNPSIIKMDSYQTNYNIDAGGKLSSITKDGGAQIANYSYLNDGNLGAIQFGNGMSQSYSYLPNGRIKTIQLKKGSKNFSIEEYSYDILGDKIKTVYLDNSRTQNSYDAAGNLKKTEYYKKDGLSPYFSQDYTYDANGNRLTYKDNFRDIAYTYVGNRLSSFTQGKLTDVAIKNYDDRGNIKTIEESYMSQPILRKNFSYDKQNRLVGIIIEDLKTGFNNNIQYFYGATGKRELKKINNLPYIYIYNDEGNIASEMSISLKVPPTIQSKHYIYAGGRKVAAIMDGKYYYFHVNDIENSIIVTDEAGNMRQQSLFDTFGNLIMMNGQNLFSFGIFGSQVDEESGLYYMGDGSYYDPKLARFIGKVNITAAQPYLAEMNSFGGQRSVSTYFKQNDNSSSGFLGIKPSTSLIKNVTAVEGKDDVGGAGFICVNLDITNLNMSVPGYSTFYGDLSASANSYSCADSSSSASALKGSFGDQIKSEVKGTLINQYIDDLIQDALSWYHPLGMVYGMVAMAYTGYSIVTKYTCPFVGVLAAAVAPVVVPLAMAAGIIYELYEFFSSEAVAEFFGFGPSYEVLDHPPEGFTTTNLNSPKNNRSLFDAKAIQIYTKLLGLGKNSGLYLQKLSNIGVFPRADYENPTTDQFGLNNAVIRPMKPFRRNGEFDGGSLGMMILNKLMENK